MFIPLFLKCIAPFRLWYYWHDFQSNEEIITVKENWQLDYVLTTHDYYGRRYSKWYGGYIKLTRYQPSYGDHIPGNEIRPSEFKAKIDSATLLFENHREKVRGNKTYHDSTATVIIANRLPNVAWDKMCSGLYIPDSIKTIQLIVYSSFASNKDETVVSTVTSTEIHRRKKIHSAIPLGY